MRRQSTSSKEDYNDQANDSITACNKFVSGCHFQYRSAVTEALLSKGANPNAKSSNGITSLLWAVIQKHDAVVDALLEGGADVNAQNKDGATPLMGAVSYGNAELVKKLLDKGANINAKGENGITAMMLAAKAGRGNIVEILLERNADLMAKDAGGKTAADYSGHDNIRKIISLHFAAQQGDATTSRSYWLKEWTSI